MPTNSNYLSVLEGFDESYYETTDPGLFGAPEFFASVLFTKTGMLGAKSEALWTNIDGDGNGWAIFVATDTTLAATVTDGAGTSVAVFDLSDVATEPYLGKIILATLSVVIDEIDGPTLHLYCNGTRVGSTIMDVSGVLPAVGSKATVGAVTPTHTSPAVTCAIAGVGYAETSTTDTHEIKQFIAAQDAIDLDGTGAAGSAQLFSNRWSAKDLNQGSLAPNPIWLPRTGAVNLLRGGVGPLQTRSYKNLAWY